MAVFKKVMKDSAKEAGILSGNAAAQNAQTATNMAADGMKLFQEKAAGPIIQNGTFATGKGNLFEYIEAAKFNTAAGRAGSTARAIITDAAGDPHAVADILIKDKGRTVKAVQAKFTQAYSKGKDVSAARSVAEQTGQMNKGWGQYDGMDRLIRKQENYDADGSLLDKAKKLAKARADSQGVNAKYYEDVYEHLTDETHYNGVSSGGTTIEEVRSAYDNPTAYAKRFERKQVAAEMKCTAKSMAKASFVTTGIVSGITNMFEVFKDKKNLADYALEPNQMAAVSSANNMLVFGDSLMVGVMNQSVKGNQELLALSRRLGAEMIDPNTIGNYKMEDEFRKIIAQLRRDIRREKPVSVPLTREFLEEADRELLQRAGGVRENVNPRMVAEIICEKMLVDRICTPEQKERFIAVFADILSNGGGEEDGKAVQ